jgi:hypothetical protein
MASFSTISLVRETPDVVRRFAEFYYAAGVDEILVYADGPAPELRALEVPGLVVIEADEAFWTDLGGERPPVLEVRQSKVAEHGLRRCRSDWLLVVDADEFVFGDRPIPVFLDAIPEGNDSVAVPTAEAVWGPGDAIDAPFGSSHFRLMWRREKLWKGLGGLVYGPIARHMQRGLTGHTSGKQFLRAGRPYSWIRNHSAERDGQGITRRAGAIDPALEGVFVGHFDAIGLERWRQKWRQRIEKDTIATNMTANRQAQMQMIADGFAAGDAATRALFSAFYGLSRTQYLALSGLGYAFRREGIAAEG